ncbi:MAG: helix-turn-helix domain-containing protein [Thermoguttaceae bacterium]
MSSSPSELQDALAPLLALAGPLLKGHTAQVVEEVLRQRDADEARLGDRLAYTEPEAAALLGIQPHVLRDCRRRGEIHARLCGKRYLYPRAELLRYLSDTRAGR